MKEKNNSILSKFITAGLIAIAAVYVLALLKIVLLKSGFTTELRTLNLIPFRFVSDFTNPDNTLDVVLKNVLGNFALFIPLGILSPIFFEKLNTRRTVLICFLVSLSFEIIQYLVGFGASDIDDLLLNTLGGAFGTILYSTLFSHSGNRIKAKIISFIFLSAFGFCGLASLWLYQPSMLPQQKIQINLEALEGLDESTYAVCARIKEIDNGVLYYEKAEPNLQSSVPVSVEGSYNFAPDAKLYAKTLSYQYSPNGNIQKVISTYSIVSPEKTAELIANDGTYADLWLDESGDCYIALLTIYKSN